jgi:hypothetical protein
MTVREGGLEIFDTHCDAAGRHPFAVEDPGEPPSRAQPAGRPLAAEFALLDRKSHGVPVCLLRLQPLKELVLSLEKFAHRLVGEHALDGIRQDTGGG